MNRDHFQIAVVSGKGGTGKTTLVSVIAEVEHALVLSDCDVDAPNLHLVMDGCQILTRDFYGASEAIIDPDICIHCGKCRMVCRFDAIDEMMCIIPLNCEGCGACGIVCPVQAIHLEPVITGQVFLDNTKSGPFAHALLAVGAEGSGKLVTEVRQLGEEHRTGEHWTIIDGSPGIGCVVIASMTGCDGVLAVVEPTLTGLSDLKRVLAVADHFCVPSFVCTNRYDINRDISRQIVIFCLQNGYHWVGQIPYDHRVMEIQKGNGSLVDSDSLAAKAMKDVWFKTKARMMTGRGSRS